MHHQVDIINIIKSTSSSRHHPPVIHSQAFRYSVNWTMSIKDPLFVQSAYSYDWLNVCLTRLEQYAKCLADSTILAFQRISCVGFFSDCFCFCCCRCCCCCSIPQLITLGLLGIRKYIISVSVPSPCYHSST